MEKLLLRVNYIRILLFTLLYLSTTQSSLGQPCPSVIPALGVTTMGQNIVCELPGKIEFKISGYEDISSNLGANYYINFGDGKYVGTVEIDGSPFNYQTHLTNEQLKAKNGVIEYTYDETYCGKPFAENNKKWVVQVRVVGCDPTLSQLGSTSMLLQQAGTADFLHSNKCDYSICFENISRSFINHQCQETFLFEWDFGDGTKRNQVNESQPVEMSFCHEYKCAGKYDVTLNAFSGYEIIEESGSYVAVGSSCGSDNITKEILVLPKPKLKKKSNINVCTGENVDEVKLQDLDVCTYDWYDKASKQCKPTDVCGILGEKVAYAFNYKVTGDYVGLDLGEYNVQEEDAKIPSFKAINNSDVAKKVKICITPYNELGCPGEEMCYEIVVHPSAKISNLKDVSFCDNTTAKINPFQSSISGVTYEWSVKSGDWSAIGLPSASGTGHMPTFTAKNSTSSPITVTIEVVANSSLCKGSVGEFKITVYPLPKYDIASQSPTTCNGTDGWIEFKNLGLNVTKYLVKYKKDGTDVEKTINVQGSSVKVTGLSKGSYTEIKIAALGSECFVGTTDITLVDPPIPNVPVISSNSPVCIGENLILKVDNADADIMSWKWTGPSCSGGVVPSSLKEPTPKPMQYCMAGEYTLQVERNKCYAESKISVTYREDPEVTLSALASVCVGSSFKIDDEVTYNWKRIPSTDQKIKWEIINNLGTVVTTQNDIQYPSFTINQAGDYTVKVTLEGFGCSGTKLVAEQPIKVKQVNYTLDVKADKNQICANEKVEFTNNTSKNDEIKYNWTVSPTTGVVFSDGTTKTSDAPKILFQEPGKYTVEVVADNECTKRTQTFNINVRKNPTVVLNKLPDLCSGETFDKVNDYVTYTWNNVEGETPVWSATPADGVVFSNPNSNYPSIKYTKPGNYTIRVDMPDISCGTKSYAESTVKVYDGSFTVDITQDNTVICEGKEVGFVNKTVSTDPIKYEWSVSPSNGVVISDATNASPKIRFNKYGDFVISVLIDGICQDETKTFNVRVNKDPEVTFSPLGFICTNKTFTLTSDLVSYVWNSVKDTEKKVTWSILDATGAEAAATAYTIDNANALYPELKFNTSGTYKLKVEVDGLGCNGIKTKAESELIVYDNTFVLDIVQDKDVICENEKVSFTNNTISSDPLDYTWSVSSMDGVTISDVKSTAPEITFTKYGDYVVTVVMDGKCSDQTKTFNVRVNKDPEVTFNPLGFTCTNKTFTLTSDLVSYVWNSVKETEKKVTWSVLDNTGAEAAATAYTIDNANALYPVLTFNTSGTYTLKVEVDGLGCNGTKTKAESKLIVYDNTFVLDIVQDKNVICENEKVSFTNNTISSDPLDYTWSVSSMDGVTISDVKSTAPEITFTKYGDYVVTVVMDGKCSDQTKTFNVRVNKDPEVTFNPLGFTCTNKTFTLTSDLVSYVWNSVKDTEKKVTWSILDATGAEAAATAYTIDNANALYPELKFNTSGTYKLKVEVDGLGCNGIKTKAESELIVYDNTFVLDIVQDKDVICENEKVSFTNNTISSDPLDYTWSVSSMDGVTISDVKSTAPEITFTKYGDYVVTVVMDGKCSDQTATYNVRVKKDPEVKFGTLETICNNNKFTFDNTKVVYTWYNMLETEKEIEWTVTPNTGVTEEDTDKEYPSYTFTETGDYTITVKVKAMGCSQAYIEESVKVTVISDNLDLQVSAAPLEGCVPLDVTFTNTTSDTDEIAYKWIVDKSDENWDFKQGTETAKSPIITLINEDAYKISLEAKNKCNTKTLEFDIKAYDEVHFKLAAIPIVCGEYIFDAKSEEQGLTVTGKTENIKSIKWVVYKSTDYTNINYQEAPTESYEFTSGDADDLYPVIKIKEWGKYKIELQTQTICNDETISTTVDIEKPIEITLTQPDPLCANIADEYGQNPYTLVADPTDGTWSWAVDVPAEQQEYLDATGKLFYPNTPGTYKLKYSVKRQACYAEKSMDVVVKDYPTMDIGADIYVCEKDQTPVLLEGTPNDGVWTGNEVSKNGSEYYFNPPLTVGDYDITYTITDAFGCKNRDYKQAHIQPLPNPNFEPKAHCLPDPVTFLPVVDVTTHQFKLDYGDGTNGTDLTHLYGEIGNYDVKLIVTAPNGCVDSLTQVLLVEKYPDQKLIVSEHEGCSPFTPEIKIEYDYSDPNVEFLWDFGPFGKQTTEQPTPVEFTTVERDTTYQFSITVKNHCGEYTVTDTVRVLALPVAKMIPSIDHGCSPLNVDFKNISLGSIRGMNYTWDFGDGSPLEYDFRVSHKFTTDHKNDSTYKVMLVAENQCGTDTTYQDIYIIPPVVYPQIVNPTPKVCVGDEVCILNETMEIFPHSEIITYKWDFGNGKISDDPKDACTVYDEPSTYMITLNITTSCGSSETDITYVEVQKQPDFKISAPDYVCHLDTVKPTISMLSKIREVSWDFGNGYSVKDIDPEYLYTEPGEYILTATATEDNFASCQASKSIPILVRELPNPEIEPLEADSCSPYVYKPKINGDVSYAIDYEDSGIIEANESHTYVNKGLEPIIYKTSIYLEDEYGCKSVKQGLVNVYPEPVASIAIVEVLEERPEVVTFASTSYGADVCRWTFPFAGKLETCKEVKESFYENKTETIYLEVANMYGCVDNDSIDYTPVFKGLYFPNTFSPNGVLEEVRTFNGVGLGLASYQLEIFDLYGNLIFKTTSLDANGSPNEGWDGRDRLGNLMPQDVYSWKVEAVYIDGSHYPYGNDVDNKEGHEVNDVTVQRGSVLLLHR